MVKDGQLLVGPKEVARRFGDQIRRLKPEILLALGHTLCPVCGRKLMIESGEFPVKVWEQIKTGGQLFCPEPRHFNKWEFEEGEGK